MAKSTDDLIQCTSCEGFFEFEKTVYHGDDNFCINCSEGIKKEIRETGIEHLDEFLETNNVKEAFFLFANAKWSGITVEELKELNGED